LTTPSQTKAAEDGSALDPLLAEVGDGVVRLGRAELAAAMGAPSVVVGLVLGQDQPQVSFAEDQHPVGDLGPVPLFISWCSSSTAPAGCIAALGRLLCSGPQA
jgi:hypothetical protein